MSYKSKTLGLGRVSPAVIAILMLAAGSSAAWAQTARGLAWARVDGTTAGPSYQYNSAGGAITANNVILGVYRRHPEHEYVRRRGARDSVRREPPLQPR